MSPKPNPHDTAEWDPAADYVDPLDRALSERDAARAVAVRLEQENAHLLTRFRYTEATFTRHPDGSVTIDYVDPQEPGVLISQTLLREMIDQHNQLLAFARLLDEARSNARADERMKARTSVTRVLTEQIGVGALLGPLEHELHRAIGAP